MTNNTNISLKSSTDKRQSWERKQNAVTFENPNSPANARNKEDINSDFVHVLVKSINFDTKLKENKPHTHTLETLSESSDMCSNTQASQQYVYIKKKKKKTVI